MSPILSPSARRTAAAVPALVLLGLVSALAGTLVGCSDGPETPRAAPADESAPAVVAPTAPSAPSAPRPDVLVLVLDSLRADRMGGAMRREDERDLTPMIDGIARSGLNAVLSFSPSPHSAPSFASLSSGLAPLVHGVRNVVGEELSVLADEVRTFPEVLQSAGWRTVLVHESGQILDGAGLFQGIDLVVPTGGLEGSTQALESVLTSADSDAPICVIVHSYGAHPPFLPPRDRYGVQFRGRYTEAPGTDPERGGRFRERQEALEGFEGNPKGREFAELAEGFLEPYDGMTDDDIAWLRDLYDENLALVDAQVGEIFDVWSDHRSFADSLVVLTSGHGLALGDEGRFGVDHGLSGATVRVPLAISGPGVTPGILMSATSTLTVPATVLELCGLQPVPAMEPSLGDLLTVRGVRDGLEIVPIQSPATGELGVAWIRYVVLERPDERGRTYYDAFADPGLLEPVELESIVVDRLDSVYASMVQQAEDTARVHRAGTAPLPPRARQRLRVLGYTQ
ncbi:sulfatase-like hydrolase/transferase [Planctomycetes bacterium Pla163]|uniref:sulfatase-like hydrolase/transferase n=1 Tax=Rohdeia mirabilis TaxID=2528008 RepID=UPI0011A140B6